MSQIHFIASLRTYTLISRHWWDETTSRNRAPKWIVRSSTSVCAATSTVVSVHGRAKLLEIPWHPWPLPSILLSFSFFLSSFLLLYCMPRDPTRSLKESFRAKLITGIYTSWKNLSLYITILLYALFAYDCRSLWTMLTNLRKHRMFKENISLK